MKLRKKKMYIKYKVMNGYYICYERHFLRTILSAFHNFLFTPISNTKLKNPENYTNVKVKESWYITLFMVNRSIKKLFLINCANIYSSQSIVNYLFSLFFQ